MTTFRVWLLRHADEETPIGDLARDVRADHTWPKGRGSLQLYRDHLAEHDAPYGALEVLDAAWARYLEEGTP